MGAADLVPGVSGGTVAFLMGIYEELILSIKRITGSTLKLLAQGNIRKAWQSVPFSFFIPLGLGVLLAIFTLAPGLTFLLDTYPVYLYSVFFGLVSASVIVVAQRVSSWRTSEVIALLIGAIGVFFIIGITPSELPATPLIFFLTGLIAFCAMILPGISGSLIMLIIGSYAVVLSAVAQRDFGLLVYLIIGGILSLALLSRVLYVALRSFHNITIAFLVGMMLGSLRKIWPWKEYSGATETSQAYLYSNVIPSLDSNALLALVLAIISFVCVFSLRNKGVIYDHKTMDVPTFQEKK